MRNIEPGKFTKKMNEQHTINLLWDLILKKARFLKSCVIYFEK